MARNSGNMTLKVGLTIGVAFFGVLATIAALHDRPIVAGMLLLPGVFGALELVAIVGSEVDREMSNDG